MTGPRRLSQSISEGDGISLIAEVDGPEAAKAAEADGAEAILVYSGDEQKLGAIREATSLPVVFYWDGQRADAVGGADACIVEARDDTGWLEHVHEELAADFELALQIEDAEHLAVALENFDPELFCLRGGNGEDALVRVLDLLEDVPAGKLAIADLRVTTKDEVAELERAGVDAVIVGTSNVSDLVGAPPPEV